MSALTSLWPFGRKKRPWHDHYPAGVPLHLEYPREPLGWLLENAAKRFPNRVACHYYSQALTYSDLLAQSRRFASVLAQAGLKPGDRVGVLLPNLPEYLVTLFGTWMAGGVVMALSPMMAQEQVVALVKTTGCRVVVTLDVLTSLLGEAGERPELVLVTSLSNRLPRLERFGYALGPFRRIGLRQGVNATSIRDFRTAVH